MTDRERHQIPPLRRSRDDLRQKAGEFFKEKKKPGTTVYEEMQTERVISDAKIAKLRSLRLAKEENDRQIARAAAEGEAVVAGRKE